MFTLEIVNDPDRVSGITTFSRNFFKHQYLNNLNIKTISSRLNIELIKSVYKCKSVYCHVLYSLDFLFIILICIMFKKKLIIVSHGNLIIRKKSKLKKLSFLFIAKFLSKLGEVKTQFLNKTEYERSFKISKYYLICPPFFNIKMKKNTYQKSYKFFYMGANYYERKGFDRMLELISAYKKKGIHSTLDLIGVKRNEALDEAIKNLDLQDVVKYVDPIFGNDKFLKMVEYDALMLLSRSEGWPMVILEAINLDIPVIVSEGTNVADLIIKYKLGVCINAYDDIELVEPIYSIKMNSKQMLDDHSRLTGFAQLRDELLCN